MMFIQSRKKLEKTLQLIPGFLTPRIELEQYATPARTAATMLHIAAYTFSDVFNHTVLDLGCGTGRLAIGASLLGAKHVIAIDIDPTALKTAINASCTVTTKRNIDWILSNVDTLSLANPIHTIIQNPPFGVQNRHSDQAFLKAAMTHGEVIYTLHAAGESTIRYLKRITAKHGFELDTIIPLEMEIPKQFHFHRKAIHRFGVQMYRIIRRS